MRSARYIAFGFMGTALLAGGVSQAADATRSLEPVPQQGQPQITGQKEQQAGYREQLQERIRNMSQTELTIMRDTSASGRARLESKPSENRQAMQQRGRGAGGYGQGYESRRRGGMGGSPGGW